MIIQTKKQFDINEIVENYELTKYYLDKLKQDEPKELREKLNFILQTVQLMNELAYGFCIEGLPNNGLVIYLKVIDKFFIRLNDHLKNNGKFDEKYLNLVEIAHNYSSYLKLMRDEEELRILSNEKDGYELLRRNEFKMLDYGLNRKICYDAMLDTDTNKYLFGDFNSFYLPVPLQRILLTITFFISILTNLPFSLNTLWSKLNIGKNYDYTVTNCSLYWPFNFWNINANWLFRRLLIDIINFRSSVKSKTFFVEQQNRFKIDYKGNLLDLNKASQEQVHQFYNDEEKIRRDNAPKIRYQNKDKIRCRFSYMKNRNLDSNTENSNKKNLKNENVELFVYSTSKFSDINLDKKPLETVNFDAKPSFLDTQVSEETFLKTLVFSVHGGGFVTQRAENEELYTRGIIENLKGVPFLSVDYSLTQAFPKVTQEILDVYLWVTSGKKEVADVIGFNPEKIIITGDSAGGLLSFQLIMIINDLNKILKTYDPKDDHFHEPILQVSSFVGLYTTFSTNGVTPSRSLFKFDILVNLSLTLVLFGKYLANCSTDEDFKNIEHTERYQSIMKKNQNINEDSSDFKTKINLSDKIKNFFKKIFFIKSTKPWYQCDYKTYKNRVDYIESFCFNPYLSPYSYKNYDDLKDISIFLIVGQFDAFLDDNIEFSRIWKGDIILDVLDGLSHGFMYFCVASNDCKESLKVYTKRMQQACGLCK